MMQDLDAAIASTRSHLLAMRNAAGHWEGGLSSSALSTATALVALGQVDASAHWKRLTSGAQWLARHQNSDGGWGDTTISKSNLSTTLLCWSALTQFARLQACVCPDERDGRATVGTGPVLARSTAWIQGQVGSLEPDDIARAVVGRYGKDKTFSVPILMLCAVCGALGEGGWRKVLPLPFELAALPRSSFGAAGLPVVSYALPALIAIGHAKFFHDPPSWLNPLRWLRAALWPRIRPMLRTLQPTTGGYLEATPLTSFVTMALASAGQGAHPCIPEAVRFLEASQREDGSWPIDTNLATWVTTLSVKALQGQVDGSVRSWLLQQQYTVVHPFTNAAPGGWAWTDLPGGVPDADDTCGALVALWHLVGLAEERGAISPQAEAGVTWLLELQNRDGGMPTFCRGWGTLPFDRSTAELTSHAIWAFALWEPWMSPVVQKRMRVACRRGLSYLERIQREDGSWVPLWFGNENAPGEDNPVHGTAMVVLGLSHAAELVPGAASWLRGGVDFLLASQHPDGGWGGAAGVEATIEETANAVHALAAFLPGAPGALQEPVRSAVTHGAEWLLYKTAQGTMFPPAPVGLYFARLWYHEKMYPVVWTLAAWEQVRAACCRPPSPDGPPSS